MTDDNKDNEKKDTDESKNETVDKPSNIGAYIGIGIALGCNGIII